MYAIIDSGSKQYRVQPGDVICVEKIDAEVGEEIKLDKVLVMGDGENAEIGTPYLDAVITAKVLEHGKGKKVIIFKYKAKKDYRKKQGHRQPYTMIEIVEVGGEKVPVVEDEAPAEEVVEEAAEAVETEEVVEEAVEEVKEEAKETVSMSMKKDELIAFANDHGIEVDTKATKQVIIDTINENL